MKVEVEADVLAAAVKHAAVLTKNVIPYTSLLLTTTANRLLVTAGDGDTFAEFTVHARVEEQGATLVPTKVFAKAVPKLNGVVSLTLEGSELEIETLTSNLKLPVVDPQTYPKVAWPESDPVDVSECWDRLRLIAYASAMALEPKFQAVKLLPDGWAEGFDKTRMARTPIPEGLCASVRKDSFDYAARVIEGSVSVATGDNAVAFYGESVRVRASVVQGEARTAMPPQVPELLAAGTQVTFDRKALLEAIGLIEVVKDDERQAIRIDIEGDEATLSAYSPDVGRVNSSVAVSGSTPWPIGITGGYVRDVLSRSTEDEVTFQFGPQFAHPIVVESDGITHMFGGNRKAVR